MQLLLLGDLNAILCNLIWNEHFHQRFTLSSIHSFYHGRNIELSSGGGVGEGGGSAMCNTCQKDELSPSIGQFGHNRDGKST